MIIQLKYFNVEIKLLNKLVLDWANIKHGSATDLEQVKVDKTIISIYYLHMLWSDPSHSPIFHTSQAM